MCLCPTRKWLEAQAAKVMAPHLSRDEVDVGMPATGSHIVSPSPPLPRTFAGSLVTDGVSYLPASAAFGAVGTTRALWAPGNSGPVGAAPLLHLLFSWAVCRVREFACFWKQVPRVFLSMRRVLRGGFPDLTETDIEPHPNPSVSSQSSLDTKLHAIESKLRQLAQSASMTRPLILCNRVANFVIFLNAFAKSPFRGKRS